MIIFALVSTAFLTGAVVSVVSLAVISVHREERSGLSRNAPTRGTKAARVLMGVRIRRPAHAAPTRLPARPARSAAPDPARHREGSA